MHELTRLWIVLSHHFFALLARARAAFAFFWASLSLECEDAGFVAEPNVGADFLGLGELGVGNALAACALLVGL